MINKARKTTFRIAKLSKEVGINKEKIAEIAKKWVGQDLSVPDWPKDMHLETDNPEEMLDYLIILDSLNFCFWSEKERWQIKYNGKNYNGYFALSLALKKFFEENPEKGNLKYFA
jgi:YHS domain-containing protein